MQSINQSINLSYKRTQSNKDLLFIAQHTDHSNNMSKTADQGVQHIPMYLYTGLNFIEIVHIFTEINLKIQVEKNTDYT